MYSPFSHLTHMLGAGLQPVLGYTAVAPAAARFWAHLACRPDKLFLRGTILATELAAIARANSSRAPGADDQRFADIAWRQNPVLRGSVQVYLVWAEQIGGLLSDAQLDWRDEELMRLVFTNLVELFAPSNNPLLNPLAWRAVIDTAGLSAVAGLNAFAADMLSVPRLPRSVEPNTYVLGETIAATAGTVVLRTDILELIQYSPQSPRVHTVPLLVVPPTINKYYLVDLAPGRSMIEYLVQRGQQVYAISWRNPGAAQRDWGVSAYCAAIIEALDAVQVIAGTPNAHVLALCSGGILAAMTAAQLAAIGQGDRIAGLALAVTVLDQRHGGILPALLASRAMRAVIPTLADRGCLDGSNLTEFFAWLRPRDMIWRYWVNNYLQGKPPKAFETLFWNQDSIRLTAGLLRDMVVLMSNNSLTSRGDVDILDTPIDLGTITADVYAVGAITDHLCPWPATYHSARMFTGTDVRYVLSAGGHVTSLINSPGNATSSYRCGPPARDAPDDWLHDAEEIPGSWWPDYAEWLAVRSGPDTAAPAAPGGPDYRPICPAPGAYARQS